MISLRKFRAAVMIACAFVLPASGCSSDSVPGGTGQDSPENAVPDYSGAMQKAQDAADQASQKQKEVEENVRQMEEGP